MSNKLLSLLFLIYLSFTYCSKCTDKTFEEGEDKSEACRSLYSESYMCYYDSTNDKCEELYCDNAPVKQCHNIPPSF